MSWRRANSPGWATVDLKQRRQKDQGLELEATTDPYPPMSTTMTSIRPCQNFVKYNDPSVRSFSSLLLPSGNIPSFTHYNNTNKEAEVPLKAGNPSGKQSNEFIEEDSVFEAYKKLKELHCWADKTLIKDVMAAVENNVDKASTLLQEMVPSGSVRESKETKIAELKSNSEDIFRENEDTIPADEGASLVQTEDSLNSKKKKSFELIDSYGETMLPDNIAHMKQILRHLRSMPVEPEWEEDDVYLIHRKDALRMMRAASQHSRAASDAYVRGDHFSAHQFSQKAQEEWMAAERLNSKAAKEILSARNCKNDMWILDLHGLHAAEAVQALQEHLQKIETEVPLNRFACPSKIVNMEASIGNSGSLESFSGLDLEDLDKQRSSSRPGYTSLEVITGKGNHSRGGEAALPLAIRSFLNESRYRYDEARPGVITVWPKFRHR